MDHRLTTAKLDMLWHTGYLGAASPSGWFVCPCRGEILVKPGEALWGNSHFYSPMGLNISHCSQIRKQIHKAHFAFGKKYLKRGKRGKQAILNLVVQGNGNGTIQHQGVHPSLPILMVSLFQCKLSLSMPRAACQVMFKDAAMTWKWL